MDKNEKLLIFFSLTSVIFVEYMYIKSAKFSFELFLIFINYFFDSFFDIIEKYLLEFDFMDPFKLIFVEGLFGFVLTCFYSFVENPFEEIKNEYKEQKLSQFFLLILSLVIYLVLCAGRNIYRVITNKIYYPITRSLTDSILDPLLITYYYIWENDFQDKTGNKNLGFFLINFFFTSFYVFFGCVYNEVLVLLCCKLGHDTHYKISRRASFTEKERKELNEVDGSMLENKDFYLNE